MKKRVGIVGGMGPLATADLMAKIIEMTKARDDCDHVHLLVESNTSIPSRADAILHGGEDPLPEMARTAQRLEAAGAELLVIACNTAHHYYDGVAASVGVPVLHMLNETARHCRLAGFGAVGLLATDMVLETGLYHRALEREGVGLRLPSPAAQAELMRLVFDGVKQNRFDVNIDGLRRELDAMLAGGVGAFVLGCTELPMGFAGAGVNVPAVDPARVLAAAAIRAAGCELADAFADYARD